MSGYVRFSREEKEQARTTDLPVSPPGRTPHRRRTGQQKGLYGTSERRPRKGQIPAYPWNRKR